MANSATKGADGARADALVHGYTTAFAVGAGLLALGALTVSVLLRSREADASAAAAEGVEALAVAA